MTESEAIRVLYHVAQAPRLSPPQDDVVLIQLFGVRRAYEDGWVYRLDGEVIVDPHTPDTPTQHIFYYDDVLVYMVNGRIERAPHTTFWDTKGQRAYTWDDLATLLAAFVTLDPSQPVDDPITDDDILLLFNNSSSWGSTFTYDDSSYWDGDYPD